MSPFLTFFLPWTMIFSDKSSWICPLKVFLAPRYQTWQFPYGFRKARKSGTANNFPFLSLHWLHCMCYFSTFLLPFIPYRSMLLILDWLKSIGTHQLINTFLIGKVSWLMWITVLKIFLNFSRNSILLIRSLCIICL